MAFDYPVLFTRDLFAIDNHVLPWAIGRREPNRRHRVLVVIDDGVAAGHPNLPARISAFATAHASVLDPCGAPMIVPGGERAKHDGDLVETLQRRMFDAHLDRQGFVIAIGGGAVLDVVGYAAATVHRGVRLVRVPSTVLAQNDAGIGVKNGVNAFGVKNFLGTFAPPWAVIDDFDLLRSLAVRDRTAGIAEAVKVAAIRDREFFTWLTAHVSALATGDDAAIEVMVRRCAALHLRHIATSGDPFETGSARPLDFGHWAAHKLEALTGGELRHGEAVAIGIAIDTGYSVATGQLPMSEGARVVALLRGLGLPLWHPTLGERDAHGRLRVLDGLAEFREHLGGELTVTLLGDIGRGVEVHAIEEAVVDAVVAGLAPAGAGA